MKKADVSRVRLQIEPDIIDDELIPISIDALRSRHEVVHPRKDVSYDTTPKTKVIIPQLFTTLFISMSEGNDIYTLAFSHAVPATVPHVV